MNAKQRIARIMDAGCRVCRKMGYDTPAQEFHHLHTAGRRRAGQAIGIGLCVAHHRGGQNNAQVVSRHPWKKQWEARFGDEWALFDELMTELGWQNGERKRETNGITGSDLPGPDIREPDTEMHDRSGVQGLEGCRVDREPCGKADDQELLP